MSEMRAEYGPSIWNDLRIILNGEGGFFFLEKREKRL